MRRQGRAESQQRERRVVGVSFDTLEDLRQAYEASLRRGGIFVPEPGRFAMREEVQVEFDLGFARTVFRMDAEVVGLLPEGLPHSGGRAGVALQLVASSAELRRTFEPLLGSVPEPDRGHQVGERRAAPRYRARVMGRLSSEEGELAVRTRNLSRSGVLISLDGIPPVPVGSPVSLLLVHPTRDRTVAVEGVVVRHVESEGHVPALAVAFTEEVAERAETQRFVDDLGSIAHARELAAIRGPLAETGVASLLQSFSAGGARGTITLCRGPEEGRVVLDGSQLLAARAGSVTGTKGLARLLAWDDGSFEFHSHVDDGERDDPALPLEVAVLDAARQVDERRRCDPLPFAMADRLELAEGGDPGKPCKTEAAILDLARVGFSVRAILDVVPEEDHVVLRAIGGLLDRGVVRTG